jgi:hypothetical protein
MKKHQNKIIYNQKSKYNYMKSSIINNNDNSFRDDNSQNKKKNQTIFIEISNNVNNQNKQILFNNHTHINKGNINQNIHKKTKTRSSLSEKGKIDIYNNSPGKNEKKFNITYIKTINIHPKRFKSKSPKNIDYTKIGFIIKSNDKKELNKKNEKILMSTLPRAIIDISNDDKISQGLNITYNNDEIINLVLKLKNKNTIISEDMKKELIKLRNNINALIDKYYNQN